MHVCKKAFCDFVVFTHRGIHVQTIQYDPEFVEELVLKCTVFALDELVPVIVRQKSIN
ncbi:hypothetical protein DPMN_045421 [Dreissena polymorpha]|uniref:Uncharacterized protein n=1 Tax=Dreissena polymorpha TaxID=45954 RepID=A0A9D4D4C1_DREPO|nr:hypothetical protein DPMN_045421 [Dreissena polymorpha]